MFKHRIVVYGSNLSWTNSGYKPVILVVKITMFDYSWRRFRQVQKYRSISILGKMCRYNYETSRSKAKCS